jgi:hypothetical protein
VNIFFILGRGRSGTTLLVNMLNMNRNIFIPREGLFVANHKKKYGKKRFTQAVFDRFFHDVFLEDRMKNWGLTSSELKKSLMERPVIPSTYQGACLFVYEMAAKKQKKSMVKIVGDKNPHYSLIVKDLVRLFPSAKFIWMTRDYRDNIISYKKMWFDLNSTGTLAYRWRFFNQSIECGLRKVDRTNVLRVAYEDLVLNHELVLKKIYDFLNVQYGEDDLVYNPKKGNGYGQEWHGQISKAVSSENILKWKSELSTKDLVVAEKICAKYGARLGYSNFLQKSNNVLTVLTCGAFLVAWIYTFLEKIILWCPWYIKFWFINKKIGLKKYKNEVMKDK